MRLLKPFTERAELLLGAAITPVPLAVAFIEAAAGYPIQATVMGVMGTALAVSVPAVYLSLLNEADQAEKRRQEWEAREKTDAFRTPQGPGR